MHEVGSRRALVQSMRLAGEEDGGGDVGGARGNFGFKARQNLELHVYTYISNIRMKTDPNKISKSKSFVKIGFWTGMFLVLLFLKLGEFGIVANWSWWWITSPLWAPTSVLIIGTIAMTIIVRIAFKARERRYRKQRNESRKSYEIEE